MQSARAAPVPSATKSPSGVEEAHEDVAAARGSIARATRRATVARAVVLSLCWACTSSALIFLNNHLLRDQGFSYPMMLSSMGVFSSWVISFSLVRAGKVKLRHGGAVTPRWYETRRPDRWIGRGVAGIRELRVLVSEREFYTDAEGCSTGGDDFRDDDGGLEKLQGCVGGRVVVAATFIGCTAR